MEIKTYKKVDDKTNYIGVYLSKREMEQLHSKAYEYCSEELMTVYAPLYLEAGYSFSMVSRTGKVTGYIQEIKMLYNGTEQVRLRIDDNYGYYNIVIKTKNLQRWNLMHAAIRKLIKNGHIYRKLYI